MHCLVPAPAGGLESVVRMLAQGQQRRGHRVVVAAIVDDVKHPFVRSLDRSGVEVVSLAVHSGGYRRERRFVGDLLRDVTADVLHTHGYRPDIIDLSVARRLGIGTVTTLHGFTGGDWKVRLYERLQMRAIQKAGAVVAVSQGVYDRVRSSGVRSERVHLIRNAYGSTTSILAREDARRALGVEPDSVRLGWIGRLSGEKGPDIMVEAFSHLRDVPVMLSFVGEGPDQIPLAARVDALGMARRVRFHGLVENAARTLGAFDALVLSSRTEGTPMVVLEAMAAGTPVIATRVGGIPDMVSETEATLVPSEDPAALAMAIRNLLADPAAAAARAERARARLTTEFGIEPWLLYHESLYRALRP
ncbi:MAG TPA: glycosyltransferase [Gemmatimonadaceae bacterium]|nr:glycosyltransferase [Gemmatimonadaceae bacterium]